MAIVLRERLWYLLTLIASNTSARARFREALKAVYVVKADNGWEVLRAGHRPVKFVGWYVCGDDGRLVLLQGPY